MAWVKALRKAWEQSCNATLERAGAEKRYDSRTYKAMGIDLDPLHHIPSTTFNKERRGEITTDGVDLACRQWDVLLEIVASRNAASAHARAKRIAARFDQLIALLEKMSVKKKPDIIEVRKMKGVAVLHARAIGLAELMQDVARLTMDRVASRARLVYYGFQETPVKSRGRPRKHPRLTNVNGLTTEAREASRFLETILARALEIDSQNTREVTIARGRFAVVMRRFEEIANNAGVPRNTARSVASLRLDDMLELGNPRSKRRQQMNERIGENVWSILTSMNPPKPLHSPKLDPSPERPEEDARSKRQETDQRLRRAALRAGAVGLPSTAGEAAGAQLNPEAVDRKSDYSGPSAFHVAPSVQVVDAGGAIYAAGQAIQIQPASSARSVGTTELQPEAPASSHPAADVIIDESSIVWGHRQRISPGEVLEIPASDVSVAINADPPQPETVPVPGPVSLKRKRRGYER